MCFFNHEISPKKGVNETQPARYKGTVNVDCACGVGRRAMTQFLLDIPWPTIKLNG